MRPVGEGSRILARFTPSVRAVAHPECRPASGGAPPHFRQSRITRPHTFNRDFNAPTAWQAYIDEGTALAVDQCSHAPVADDLPPVPCDVGFDTASGKKSPAIRLGHDHLGADRAGSAISCNDCRQCEAQTLVRSEEHTSELQSLMRISYAVFS